MASITEDGTAAATEQLGSMSLRSKERKDNDKPTTKNGTSTSKLLCSACGKKSNTLKKCAACKCVWYCDKECQNKHRKEHRKECRGIKKELDKRGGKLDVGNEMDVGPLGNLPPQEECPICMRVLPIHAALQTYHACCGKTICGGCDFQHQMKSGERKTCAFCRMRLPQSDEEIVTRLSKRVELKDPNAMNNLALIYGDGGSGLPVDHAKCIELLRQSASLGFPGAHYQLGLFHGNGEMGLQQNEEEANRHHKEAAEGGHLPSRHNIGCKEYNNDNPVAAMRHWRLCSSLGTKRSMECLIVCFEDGLIHHRDLAESIQVMYRARAEMKSDDRDKHIAYLKMAGKYDEDFDT
jgi:hypothetical protein